MTERVYAENVSAPISASGQVAGGAGRLRGILVTASTNGTLKAWDNTAGSGTVLFDTTAVITAPYFLECADIKFTNGLYITVGGTIACTVIWARA